MLHQIVSIFDSTAHAYLKPVFVHSDGAAVRSFQDAVNDPTTDFAKHPDDYSMHSLGTWDDSTGEFTPSEKLTVLAKASGLVNETVPF